MLSKKNLFLPLFALSFSSFSHTYKVDPKLLRSWTPELEESEHLAEIPYNVMWQREDKKLIYALTTCHPNHQNKFESNVATLRNNYPQAYILHQESLDNYIEQLLTQLSLEEVRTRDLYYCLVTDTLNQIEQFNLKTDSDLAKVTQLILKSYTQLPIFQDIMPDMGDYTRWFMVFTGQQFCLDALRNGMLVAPMNDSNATKLQRLSYKIDQIADTFFLQKIAEALETHDTVIVIRAASKFVTEKIAINTLMNAQPELVQ